MVLSTAEMSERFGFYLMLSIFTLFLTEYHGLSKERAGFLYGLYMMGVYLTPIFGGWIADTQIGYRRAISMGAGLLGAGYAIFALKSPMFLVIALGLLILGNGLFKPNISTLVGKLYHPQDPKRDSGFGLFYLGINVGALPAGPLAGYLRTHYGWGTAFATAAVAMLFSLLVFELFCGRVRVYSPSDHDTGEVIQLEQNQMDDPPRVVRAKQIAMACLCGTVMFFWMAFHQNGTSLTYWARDNTLRDLQIGTWHITLTPETFQLFNSLFVIFLTPLPLLLYAWMERKNRAPLTSTKIGIGMAISAFAYTVLMIPASKGDAVQHHMGWLIGFYLIQTIAELLLSPMGLSLVSKLAPKGQTGRYMGMWFIATAMGNFLVGVISAYWETISHLYYFGILVGVCSAASLGIFLLRGRINQAI